MEFKPGDRVADECGNRGKVTGRVSERQSYVAMDAGLGIMYDNDKLTLLPEAKACDKEEWEGIGGVWLPGTVESVTPLGDWYYIGIDTPRGTIVFPVTRDHARAIRVGEEYSISMRRGV